MRTFLKQQEQAIDYLLEKYIDIKNTIVDLGLYRSHTHSGDCLLKSLRYALTRQCNTLWHIKYDTDELEEVIMQEIGKVKAYRLIIKDTIELTYNKTECEAIDEILEDIQKEINKLDEVYILLARSFYDLKSLKKLEELLDERLNDNN